MKSQPEKFRLCMTAGRDAFSSGATGLIQWSRRAVRQAHMNSVPARAVEVSMQAITFLDTKLVEPINFRKTAVRSVLTAKPWSG